MPKEVYGAKIHKSPSAARVRASEVGLQHKKEESKPDQKYKLGDMVSVPLKYFGFTNGKVVGWEWGGDRRDVSTSVWCYWVTPSYEAGEAKLIPETEMGRISP